MSDKIKPGTQEVADKIMNMVVKKDSTHWGEEEPNKIFESILPDDVTMAQIDRIDDIRTTFVAGSALAAGQLSVESMTKDKSIDRVTCTLGVGGRNKVEHCIDRSKEFGNPFGGDGTKVTKYGNITTSYDVYAGRNAGQLKQAKLAIGESALAAFGK